MGIGNCDFIQLYNVIHHIAPQLTRYTKPDKKLQSLTIFQCPCNLWGTLWSTPYRTEHTHFKFIFCEFLKPCNLPEENQRTIDNCNIFCVNFPSHIFDSLYFWYVGVSLLVKKFKGYQVSFVVVPFWKFPRGSDTSRWLCSHIDKNRSFNRNWYGEKGIAEYRRIPHKSRNITTY